MAVLVLDQVKMLDQQVAPARPLAEQSLDLAQGGRIDLPPLQRIPAAAAPRTGMILLERIRRAAVMYRHRASVGASD
jgi:hypothetical protein